MADADTKREQKRRRRKYVRVWILFTLLGLLLFIIDGLIAYSYFPSGIATGVFFVLLIASESPVGLVWERRYKKPYDEWRKTHELMLNTDNDAPET